MNCRRDGFILIAALWLIVALGAVGLDASLRSRTRRLAAANVLDQTRARAAATAGTEYARSRLTAAMLDRALELRNERMSSARTARARRSATRASVNSLFRSSDPLEDPWRDPQGLIASEMAFGDARYTLRIHDTGAFLNLNAADENMLRQFFAQGLRVDYALADRLTQAILDWRDEDEIPRIGGGEREEYLAQRMPVLPPNRDFAELDELRHVLGMTPELYDEARDYLTLVGSGDVNVNSAPEAVLLALPGMTPPAVTTLLRARTAGQTPRSAGELRGLMPAGIRAVLEDERTRFNRVTTFRTNEVEIIADGRVENSPMVVRARVVVARSNTGAVVVWRKIH
ncbi:MAG: general secretion pathway protein GspK [Longimicrobiales bacterium]